MKSKIFKITFFTLMIGLIIFGISIIAKSIVNAVESSMYSSKSSAVSAELIRGTDIENYDNFNYLNEPSWTSTGVSSSHIPEHGSDTIYCMEPGVPAPAGTEYVRNGDGGVDLNKIFFTSRTMRWSYILSTKPDGWTREKQCAIWAILKDEGLVSADIWDLYPSYWTDVTEEQANKLINENDKYEMYYKKITNNYANLDISDGMGLNPEDTTTVDNVEIEDIDIDGEDGYKIGPFSMSYVMR